MLIKLVKNVFVAECSFAEKDVVKSAGFWWHGGGCRPGCKACEAGVSLKVWWTPKVELAVRLAECATPEAKAAMQSHVTKVASSHATNAEIDIPAPEGLAYLPYQKAGIAYAAARKNALIADEMGLGKTIQALGAINTDETIKNVLVVCPASLRLNWIREAQKWLVRPFVFHLVDAAEPPPADATFIVVNYNRLSGKAGQAVFEALMAQEWDILIVDEAHYCKNPKSQRSQAVLGAR